jgi:hypothetical protein
MVSLKSTLTVKTEASIVQSLPVSEYGSGKNANKILVKELNLSVLSRARRIISYRNPDQGTLSLLNK